jgi:hypothetical protein
MNVVETFKVAKSDSKGVRRNRNVACARTVNWTIDPQGVDGGTVPVHSQLSVAPVNVAPTVGPPGPNCTETLLLVNDQFVGVNSVEMLPPSVNVRFTDGRPPLGDVIVTNSWGGGMVRPLSA